MHVCNKQANRIPLLSFESHPGPTMSIILKFFLLAEMSDDSDESGSKKDKDSSSKKEKKDKKDKKSARDDDSGDEKVFTLFFYLSFQKLSAT